MPSEGPWWDVVPSAGWWDLPREAIADVPGTLPALSGIFAGVMESARATPWRSHRVLVEVSGEARHGCVELEHGERPYDAAARAARIAGLIGTGLSISDVLVEAGGQDDEDVLRMQFRPGSQRPKLRELVWRGARDVDVAAAQVQRVGAYAVICQDDRILMTQLATNGMWTLPGGGVDPGEQVRDALVREVYEECGVPFTIGKLVDVTSVHFHGRSPSGFWEDFHALRVVFSGSVPDGVVPEVVEVGGSTSQARWVHRAELSRMRLGTLATAALAQDILAQLSPQDAG